MGESKHRPSPADYGSKVADGTEVGPEASGRRGLDMNESFVSGPAYFPVVGAAYPKVCGLPALLEVTPWKSQHYVGGGGNIPEAMEFIFLPMWYLGI